MSQLTSENSQTLHYQVLDAATIPLYGRHLIEASAGTGKTYNITRLYLRLLLEKQLTVQQILVMTFTKAATEEIRGRIAEAISETLNNWDELVESDAFYQQLSQCVDFQQVVILLNAAQLSLDEAAIFTIHGFCNRVLKQHAFATGMPLELEMEADTSELLLQVVRDWFRQLSSQAEHFALLQQEKWHTPERFIDAFKQALMGNMPVYVADEASVTQAAEANLRQICSGFTERKQQVLEGLYLHEKTILDTLVNTHKDCAKRTEEWSALLAWLNDTSTQACPKAVGDFINGNRYRGNTEITEIFAPLKRLRDDFAKAFKANLDAQTSQLAQLPVFSLVKTGIEYIRQRFQTLKQQKNTLDFDDLIGQLSEQLSVDNNGGVNERLVEVLREQYPVALVDEFQDTDPQQYAILDAVYAKPKGDAELTAPVNQLAIFMIGDPKQAIYGFRGGDIFTYLAAREQADHHWLMDTNWRSTSAVIAGYNRLFYGAPLNQSARDVFDYAIQYEAILATDKAKAATKPLTYLHNQAAIHYGLMDKSEDKLTADVVRQTLAIWTTNQIIQLLSQAQLGEKKVEPQDIAILVRGRNEADVIKTALMKAGLKSVYLSDRTNIYQSSEAMALYHLLEGIIHFDDERLLIRAYATSLLGANAQQLHQFKQAEYIEQWETAVSDAARLKQTWLQQGVMSLILGLLQTGIAVADDEKERALTNFLHLAELLQKASRQHKHPHQLLKWYKEQLFLQQASSEAEQRLESDADLIKIVTMHGSKGLEYPIVFVPFANYFADPLKFGASKKQVLQYFDEASQTSRLQLGADFAVNELVTREALAENMRLLYVAVTRASHQCFIGLGAFSNNHQSAIAKAFGIQQQAGAFEEWQHVLDSLIADRKNSTSYELLPLDLALNRYQALAENELITQVAELTDKPNDSWAMYSFSALTREQNATSQQGARRDIKQRDSDDTISAHSHTNLLRFSLAKGAAAGNLLHDILEHTDFSKPDWPRAMRKPLKQFARLKSDDITKLQSWLDSCLNTKLPSLHQEPEFSLSELSYSHTLREAEFYFPLDKVDSQLIADCLSQHRKQQSSFEPVHFDLAEPLAGMMHGFIDLIFEHNGRYYVADYKSTHLGEQFSDYQSDALQANNQAHLYDLQYLIYSVALHRYLKARIVDYSPEIHFGGVYYLYLRGMSAENTAYQGVFACCIEQTLLLKLDDIFTGVDEVIS